MFARLLDKLSRFGRRGQSERKIKSFSDDQQKGAAFDSRVRGIRTVAMDRIVGSVGRYQDFDTRFRLKQHVPHERLEKIKQAMREGRPLPPVKLYQIRDEYYAVDGNHRIAAAKELGHDEILAHIVEFIPSGNSFRDMLYRERADFTDRTELHSDIPVTELGQYHRLLGQIERHHQFLTETQPEAPTFQQAASDWYRTIYKPLCNIIKQAKLIRSFPERTVADLYIYISTHQWESNRKRRYGRGVDELILNDMEAFRDKMARMEETDYPEMRRDIIAFILMTVQARKEHKIIEKLSELDEIKEIHSVHGDVDLLVKVNLSRDLLSSDAEIISQFVHGKVRQLPGVHSTKTLIPGFSRIRD